MRFIGAPIGNGRKTMATPSHTAGNRKAVFSSTAGKVTTRRCCSTYWDLARRPIHCPKAAMRRGLQLTNGNTVTDLTIFTPGRYSRTSSRISGLIFVVFGMHSCVPKALIISRTAAVRPMCSNNTPSTIRSNLPAIVLVAGALPPARARVPTPSK